MRNTQKATCFFICYFLIVFLWGCNLIPLHAQKFTIGQGINIRLTAEGYEKLNEKIPESVEFGTFKLGRYFFLNYAAKDTFYVFGIDKLSDFANYITEVTITGTWRKIPEALCKCDSLVEVSYIGMKYISPDFFDCFAQNQNLKKMNIHSAYRKNISLNGIGKMSQVLKLDLRGLGIKELPDDLFQLVKLKSIYLDKNKIKKWDRRLTKLNLESIGLTKNPISDFDGMEADLAAMKNLKIISIGGDKNFKIPIWMTWDKKRIHITFY